MFSNKALKLIFFLSFLPFWLNSCGTGVDARKYPPQPELRVKKNLEEGRGFRFQILLRKIVQQIMSLQVLMNFGEHHLMPLILCL